MRRSRRNHTAAFKAKVALAALKRDMSGPSVKDMQAKIGQIAMENDLFSGALDRMGDASARK